MFLGSIPTITIILSGLVFLPVLTIYTLITSVICAECVRLKFDPLNSLSYCVCKSEESGEMIECSQCRDWFHDECVELSALDLKQILFFYCHDCSSKDGTLKTIYKDYTKEHTKPLFKKHNILSIFNLYPYFCLNETYKILKFRTPYSLYELETSGPAK